MFLRARVGWSIRTNIGSTHQIKFRTKDVLERRELLKRLVVSWMTLFVIGADLFVVSPLLSYIARGFGISPTMAGLGVSLFAFGYVASAPFFGRLADKLGRRRMLLPCLVCFAAANLVTASAVNLTWFLVARSAAGVAAAGVSPSVYALVSAYAPAQRRATHLAIAVSGLMVSLLLAVPAAAIAAAHFGWSSVFAGLSAASWLLALANRRVWPEEHRRVGPTSDLQLHIPTLVLRLVPMVVWSTALYAMFTYLGACLTLWGYSVHERAAVMLFYGVGGIAGALVGGRLADRIGARATSTAGLVGLGCCLLLAQLSLHGSPALVDCAFLLLSAAAQLFFPAQQAGLATAFTAQRATVLAWNNSALFLGIALGALIGGQAVAFGGFEAELAVSAVLAIIGGAINLSVLAGPGAVSHPDPAET